MAAAVQTWQLTKTYRGRSADLLVLDEPTVGLDPLAPLTWWLAPSLHFPM